MTQKKYSTKSFRRITEQPEIASMRDYLEYSMTLNKEQKVARENYLSRSPQRTPQRGAYHDPSEATLSPVKHIRDINGSPLIYNARDIQVKPKLLEKSLATNPNFQTLPDGYKRIFATDKKD